MSCTNPSSFNTVAYHPGMMCLMLHMCNMYIDASLHNMKPRKLLFNMHWFCLFVRLIIVSCVCVLLVEFICDKSFIPILFQNMDIYLQELYIANYFILVSVFMNRKLMCYVHICGTGCYNLLLSLHHLD